jgi:hypothetical protein
LPVLPTRKYCTVNNLAFDPYHGMEEVIGSIPIRSTKYLKNLASALPEHYRSNKTLPARPLFCRRIAVKEHIDGLPLRKPLFGHAACV